jgi:hypothetical protein
MLAALAATFPLAALAQDPAASPAAATGPCEEAAKGELYKQYYDVRKTDQPKAYEFGKQYLAKYESCADNYTSSVKKFVTAYEKATLRIDFFKAYDTKDVAKLNTLGRQLLTNDPNDAAVALLAAVGVYQGVQDKKPGVTDADAAFYVDKAVELIGAGQQPKNLADQPSWLPFANKDDALSFFTFSQGAMFAKNNNPAEALKKYVAVAQSAGKDKETPVLYAAIAQIYRNEVAPLYEKYKTFTTETDESRLLLANINRIVDSMIDAYARAVAYSTTPADKAKYMADLTELYKSRHNNTDTGLTEFIAGIKSQPITVTPPITTLPAATPATTPTPGADGGAAANGQTAPTASPVANPAAPAAKPAATTTTNTAAAQPKPAATTAAPAKKKP